MEKFKKGYKSKAVLLATSMIFLCNIGYSYPLSRNSLRVPMAERQVYQEIAEVQRKLDTDDSMEQKLLNSLPGFAKEIVNSRYVSDPRYREGFADNLDSTEYHDKEWHRWGIITHTKKVLEMYHNKAKELLTDWKTEIEAHFDEKVDGITKEDLFVLAILLHDIGKFAKEWKNGKYSMKNHAEISRELILDKEGSIYRYLKETLGLTPDQIKYIATVAGIHYELGEVRSQAGEGVLGYSLAFVRSDAFKKGVDAVKDRIKKYNIKFETYKVEIGVFFLVDSLGKTDILLGKIIAEKIFEKDDAAIESLTSEAENEIGKRNLSADLIKAVKQIPVNIAIAKRYFQLVFNEEAGVTLPEGIPSKALEIGL